MVNRYQKQALVGTDGGYLLHIEFHKLNWITSAKVLYVYEQDMTGPITAASITLAASREKKIWTSRRINLSLRIPRFLPLRKHVYSNIYKIPPPKTENFQIKNSDISNISAQNIDCGYSLELPLTSTDNLCFWAEIKNEKIRKIMYTPVNPYTKVGFKGVKII